MPKQRVLFHSQPFIINCLQGFVRIYATNNCTNFPLVLDFYMSLLGEKEIFWFPRLRNTIFKSSSYGLYFSEDGTIWWEIFKMGFHKWECPTLSHFVTCDSSKCPPPRCLRSKEKWRENGQLVTCDSPQPPPCLRIGMLRQQGHWIPLSSPKPQSVIFSTETGVGCICMGCICCIGSICGICCISCGQVWILLRSRGIYHSGSIGLNQQKPAPWKEAPPPRIVILPE